MPDITGYHVIGEDKTQHINKESGGVELPLAADKAINN
jgi:hypothetical protein